MRSPVVILLLISYSAWAQTDSKAVFEAASIKMSAARGGGGHSHENDSPGLLRASMTLKSYVVAAYGVKPYQVSGGPEWVDDSTYDIVAKLENARDDQFPANLTPRQRSVAENRRLHEALQALLAERFQLKIHHETKEMPAYALTVAKSGFKLKESASTKGCGTNSNGNGVSVKLTATCIDMAALSSFLTRQMGRPVANLTNLAGLYDFTMEWTPDDLKSVASADQPALPSLFTALQDRFGLKLEPRKAPVDFIIVDGAERPTEN